MSTNDTNKKTIEFISNWQKRSAKQQVTFIVVLFSTMVLTIAISLLAFAWYRNSNYNRIIDLNMNYLQDNTLQTTYQIEQRMNENTKIIQKYAKQYAFLEATYLDNSIENKIHLLWDNTIFDHVCYVSKEGLLTSLDRACTVGDRSYFSSAMRGEFGYTYIDETRITGKPALLFYAPIYKGEDITGIILGLHEKERIDSQLTYTFLNYQSKIYLMQGDGVVIGSSNDMYISENMFDVLSVREFNGKVSFEDVKKVIDDDSEKTVSFTFIDEGSSSIGVFGQFLKSDFMVLSVLPSEITDAMILKANKAGQTLMLFVSIAFIVLIAMFIIFLFRQRKRMNYEMTMATANLLETTAHDQRQSFIIESLSNTFSSVYFGEVESKTYERVFEENISVEKTVTNSGNWAESFMLYIDNFVNKKDREKMQQFVDIAECAKRLESDETLSAEYQRPDNDWRKAIVIPAEKDADGHVKSLIFAVQKIDAEKKRELDTKKALEDAYDAAKLASNAKTTFLSNISHDIRTPMNAIVGMSAIAGSNLDNSEKVADCLKKINIASKHLLGIINEVLDMSKIETGKVDLSEEEFHLPDLFDELITINQPLIKERRHKLSIKVNSLEHENVIGDSVRLQQVFTNLLTNAIKYTPNGGKLEVQVSEKPTNKPNIGWYEVVFKDNGIGMSEEFQKNLFEPFSRAKDSRIAGIQGTGLGMPIARNIIRMMNGDILVESEINKGSKFTVSFALKLQTEKDTDYSKFVDLPILVIDDDVTTCEMTCNMLNSICMNSEYVTTGAQAIQKTLERHQKQDDYYAIIVDWQMPEMNGIQTAKAIREQVGEDIPIIVISAYDWTEIEQEARSVGVNAFLSKPLFKSRLVNLFTELVGKNSTVEEGNIDEIQPQLFKGKRVLLAEDNELNCEIAVEILSMMGIEVDTAENGRVCLEKFTASPVGYYDLIFMDIQMPEMDGYQAASAIRVSEHPQAKLIPILAMSANAFSTDVRNAIASGMNGHVAKPIDIDKLINALKDALSL